MNRKRSIQIAVVAVIVIVVVVVLLCIRGCGGGGPKGHPIVIEVSIRAGDDLMMFINVEPDNTLAGGIVTDPDADGQLLMSPELIAAIKKGAGDHSVELPEGVTEPDGIGAVVIERINYTGQGRGGGGTRIRLAAGLPDPPQRKTPDKVVIGADDPASSLYDVVPWPEGISWALIGDDKLKVTSGKTVLELAVGESGELDPVTAEIPVSIEEVDSTADIPDGDDVKVPTVKRDLGKVKFTTSISVRYLGRLKITEDKQ
ncbi:MAG: hypothetical protein QGH60_11620 [Phycisphaerae bacterium]|nr:hypothetical protein [Phycisphaerae bacterium]